MQGVFSVTLVLLVALMVTTEANKHKKGPGHKKEGKDGKAGSDCTDMHYGKCVPNSGDCGAGVREATCNGQTQKHDCSIPCNWKKDFPDCKYKLGHWGECDSATGTKTRSGTLKKAMFNAECLDTIKVTKPCAAKPKKAKGKKAKGGEN